MSTATVTDQKIETDGKAIEISLNGLVLDLPLNGAIGKSSKANTIIYTPTTGFIGTDRFTYDNNQATNTVTITVNPPKPPSQISYKVRDSITGDEIEVVRDICGRCKLPISDLEVGHKACRREVAIEAAAEEERIRQFQCKEEFGQVFSKAEHLARKHPNSIVEAFSMNETWNQLQKRLEEEKREAHFKMLRDRDLRKRDLPFLENQVRSLRAQIERDNREAEEEAKSQEQSNK
jgi:hypothetical protein